MSNKSSKNSKSAAATSNAGVGPSPAVMPTKTVASVPTEVSTGSKSRLRVPMFNWYVIALIGVVMVLFASRINVMQGQSSELKQQTITYAEDVITVDYGFDSSVEPMPFVTIGEILNEIGLYIDRMFDPDNSNVEWVSIREGKKLFAKVTKIIEKSSERLSVRQEMAEKTYQLFKWFLTEIDLDIRDKQKKPVGEYNHKIKMNPASLAKELKQLIRAIGTIFNYAKPKGSGLSEASYIKYSEIRLNSVLLTDILIEYSVLFREMHLDKVLRNLYTSLEAWKKASLL